MRESYPKQRRVSSETHEWQAPMGRIMLCNDACQPTVAGDERKGWESEENSCRNSWLRRNETWYDSVRKIYLRTIELAKVKADGTNRAAKTCLSTSSRANWYYASSFRKMSQLMKYVLRGNDRRHHHQGSVGSETMASGLRISRM